MSLFGSGHSLLLVYRKFERFEKIFRFYSRLEGQDVAYQTFICRTWKRYAVGDIVSYKGEIRSERS
jgi:hypothetical protein